jgi:hypothetical protein
MRLTVHFPVFAFAFFSITGAWAATVPHCPTDDSAIVTTIPAGQGVAYGAPDPGVRSLSSRYNMTVVTGKDGSGTAFLINNGTRLTRFRNSIHNKRRVPSTLYRPL